MILFHFAHNYACDHLIKLIVTHTMETVCLESLNVDSGREQREQHEQPIKRVFFIWLHPTHHMSRSRSASSTKTSNVCKVLEYSAPQAKKIDIYSV